MLVFKAVILALSLKTRKQKRQNSYDLFFREPLLFKIKEPKKEGVQAISEKGQKGLGQMWVGGPDKVMNHLTWDI